MRDVRNDRGGYDHIIAAAVAALVVMAAPGASAQSNPATSPQELAIDAAVPMPEPANAPPPSPSDFSNLARGLVTGEPVKTEAAKVEPAKTETQPAPAAPVTTATAPAKEDVKQDEPKKDDVVAKPPVPAAPATVQSPPEPAKPASALASADQPIADKIKDVFTARAARVFDRKDERTAAENFYKERSYAPLWIENGAVSTRAKAAIARLQAAGADGLSATDYPVPDFAAATTPDALADADLKLTASVLDYARHAQGGRMHYSRVSADIAYPEHNPEPADVLANMAKAKDAAAALDSYNPQHKGYKALKAKLAELRGTSEGAQPAKMEEGPALKFVRNAKNAKKPVPVMDDPRVPQLRSRLGVTENADSTEYDQAVADAVRKYQSDNDMKATGVLDNQTVRAMNSPKRGRTIDLVVANMERWRWLPRELGEPKLGNAYVMLNIPDFTLRVMHNGAQAWTTRVVTGKPGKQATPELSETMKFITVNPTWNVPPSIVYNEYLPALQQDPTVLDRMGLRLVQNRDGSVHISQPPGAGNALGRIRFNFPNKFLVYQHDTPDKHLFAHDVRAYSHGCMRVQNPDMYAEQLLSIAMPKENYSAARIRSMYGNSEIDLRFPTPIPVHIVYHTAFVDEAGHLQTRRDVYGRDARLLEVLRGGDRSNIEMAVNHAKPSYGRPPTTLPPGVAGATASSSGRGFFETLFGVQPTPPPQQQRPQRRVGQRQASR